jgi:outer membrane protein TolC
MVCLSRRGRTPYRRFSGVLILGFGMPGLALAASTVQPPEGYPSRLTLEFVVRRAEKSFAPFQALEGDRMTLELPELRARASAAPRLNFGVRRLIDRNEPNNPFAPFANRTTTVFAGFQRGIAWTGTQLGLELQTGRTVLNFPTFAFDPYFETRLGLSVSQSLWQSLWRGADRERLRSAEAGRLANRLQFEADSDRAARETIELYYRSWFAQAEVRAAQAALKNKRELREVTLVKNRRGTAERPDLLQADAAVSAAETQLSEAKRRLGDIWRLLVVTLDLPSELLELDPMLVPVDLDAPFATAEPLCRGYREAGFSTVEGLNLLARIGAARAEEAARGAEALRTASGFDLQLRGTYAINGIDSASRGATWRQTLAQDFPAWSVELAASVPLGEDATAAEARSAAAQAVRARVLAEDERDRQAVDRVNRCLELEERQRAHAAAQRVHASQSERLRLEQERFRLGRSSLTQMVIAADDEVLAESQLQRAEVERRLAAWSVIGLEGGVLAYAKGERPPGSGDGPGR